MTQSAKSNPKAKKNRGSGKGLTFLRSVMKRETDDCIDWPFYKMANGYGQVGTHDGMRLAHRVICEWEHGPPPFKGAQAAHRCGNRACVNRRHTRWATQAENEEDKRSHGTWETRKSSAKINAITARKIREMFNSGMSCKEISQKLAISYHITHQVIRGVSWRDI